MIRVLVLCLAVGAAWPQPKAADPFAPLAFLAGEWVGEGGGSPGAGTGSFSFRRELAGQVLVRKNRSDYPATKERPAFTHEDLMIVCAEDGGLRAYYFDNEGHTIRYRVSASTQGVEFVSDASAPGPRFRLTYRPTGGDTVSILFEIAPPGKPEAFARYVEGSARRQASR